MPRITWLFAAALLLVVLLMSSAFPQALRVKPVPGTAGTPGVVAGTVPSSEVPDPTAPEAGVPPFEPSLLHEVAVPPSRATLIRSLLQDPTARVLLEEKAMKAGINSNGLLTCTLEGETVVGEPVGVVTPLSGAVRSESLHGTLSPPPDMVATPLPTLEELDWAAGLEFSPRLPGPRFADAGVPFSVGALLVRGASLPFPVDLEALYESDTMIVGPSSYWSYARLCVELPDDPGTYLLAAQATPVGELTMAQAAENCWLYVEEESGSRLLDLAPVSDGSGLVALATIDPLRTRSLAPRGVPEPWQMGMRHYSALVTLYFTRSETFVFGGFTVTRL
jgi:hypothetical protein